MELALKSGRKIWDLNRSLKLKNEFKTMKPCIWAGLTSVSVPLRYVTNDITLRIQNTESLCCVIRLRAWDNAALVTPHQDIYIYANFPFLFYKIIFQCSLPCLYLETQLMVHPYLEYYVDFFRSVWLKSTLCATSNVPLLTRMCTGCILEMLSWKSFYVMPYMQQSRKIYQRKLIVFLLFKVVQLNHVLLKHILC